MSDKRTIEIYIGYANNTWDTDVIEVIDEGIFPIEDLVYSYMKKYGENYKNMVFYGIYNIVNDEDYISACDLCNESGDCDDCGFFKSEGDENNE